MPITIRPSRSVVIDFDRAVTGDMIVVTLENEQKLFLGYIPDDSYTVGGYFTFDERWLPPDLIEKCNSFAHDYLFELGTEKLRRHGPGSKYSGSIDSLSLELRRSLRVGADMPLLEPPLDVGRVPYAYLNEPGVNVRRYGWTERWIALAPIASIEVATEGEAQTYYKSTRSTPG